MKTFKDVYKLPFKFLHEEYTTHVVPNNTNNGTAFQFIVQDKALRRKLLDVINGNGKLPNNGYVFYYDKSDEQVKDQNGKSALMIRGWGYLTGVGSLNLSAEEAVNIQDSLAEYIVNQLNRRK